jgi:hypothetical protein
LSCYSVAAYTKNYVEMARATGRECLTLANRQSGSDSWRGLCHDNAEYRRSAAIYIKGTIRMHQRFAGANFTAGGRELFASRSREAGDSVLVKTERERKP